MFCKKCGAELPADAGFCQKCGAKVNDSFEKNSGLSPHKNRKKPIKLLVGIFALVLAGVLIFFAVLPAYKTYLWKNTNYQTISGEDFADDPGTVYELNEEFISADEELGIEYVNNVIIVYFKSGYTDEDLNDVVKGIDGQIIGHVPSMDQYQIRVNTGSLTELEALCDKVNQMNGVMSATVDLVLSIQSDSVASDMIEDAVTYCADWNSDMPSGFDWWLEAVEAPEAWEYKDLFGEIKVGVIDTTFDCNSPNLCINKTESTVLSSLDDISQEDPSRDWEKQTHGTHVAGIICGNSESFSQKDAKVLAESFIQRNSKMPQDKKDSINEHYIESFSFMGILPTANVDVFSYNNGYESLSSLEKKFVYAANAYICKETESSIYQQISNAIILHDCKVINISAGLASVNTDRVSNSEVGIDIKGREASCFLGKLVEKEKDFIIIQSAGNEGAEVSKNGLFSSIDRDNCFESEQVKKDEILDRIIIVGAAELSYDMEMPYQLISFSNYGYNIDVCAPGHLICSTIPGGYEIKSGTSQAAPIVTGITSMVWSMLPSLSGPEIKEIVCSSASTNPSVIDNNEGRENTPKKYRMVNAKNAVKKALEVKDDMAANNADYHQLATELEKSSISLSFNGTVKEPEDIVLKYYDALKSGDYTKGSECLDPATEKELKLLGKVLSGITDLLSAGNGLSINQLFVRGGGQKDVEVIECKVIQREYDEMPSFLEKSIKDNETMQDLVCNQAEIYLKCRYYENGDCFIKEGFCTVKKYKGYGWRIDAKN